MLRFLADENFNGHILNGLRRRRPGIDILRAQDVGLSAIADPAVLEWAAENNCVTLTHDRATMIPFACERIASGELMPGMLYVATDVSVAAAIDEILLIDELAAPDNLHDQVIYLPM